MKKLRDVRIEPMDRVYAHQQQQLEDLNKLKTEIKKLLITHENELRLDLEKLHLEPDNQNSNLCGIGLDRLSVESEIIFLPGHGSHIMHYAGIGEWITTETKCPMCKSQITIEKIKQKLVDIEHKNRFNEDENEGNYTNDKILRFETDILRKPRHIFRTVEERKLTLKLE